MGVSVLWDLILKVLGDLILQERYVYGITETILTNIQNMVYEEIRIKQDLS